MTTLRFSLLLVLGAGCVAGQNPSWTWVRAWSVTEGRGPSTDPERVHLDPEAVRESGWFVGAARGQWANLPPPPQAEGMQCRVRSPREHPLRVALDPRDYRFEIDGGVELPTLPTRGGAALVFAPAGEHLVRARAKRPPGAGWDWWIGLLGPFLFLLPVSWVLARKGLPLSATRATPASRARARMTLGLVALLAWSWTLPLAPLSFDYPLLIETPSILEGRPPVAATFDPWEPGAFLAHAPVHRPLQFTLIGLQSRWFGDWMIGHRLVLLGFHILAVLGLHALLARLDPKAAFWGALIACLWPAAAQSFTWLNGGAIVMSLGLGLGALWSLLVAFERGSRRAWMLAAGLGLAATLCKESGAPFILSALGLFALTRPVIPWRARTAVLMLAASTAVAWGFSRWYAGAGLPTGVQGLEFGDPIALLREAGTHLPSLLGDACRPTLLMDSKATHPFSAQDDPAWLVQIGEPLWKLPWAWIFGGAFVVGAGLLVRSRGVRWLGMVLGMGVVAAIASLPEALVGEAAPSTARRLYIASFLGWAALSFAWAAVPLQGWWLWLRRLGLSLVCLALLSGMVREATHRVEVSGTASRWLKGAGALVEATRAEIREHSNPTVAPPIGVFAEHLSPEGISGPIMGPDLTGHLRPPLSVARTMGATVLVSASGRDHSFWRAWPFGLVHLRTEAVDRAPRRIAFHPPLPAPLAAQTTRAALRRNGALHYAPVWRTDRLRGIGAYRIECRPPLAPGTELTWDLGARGGQRVRLDQRTPALWLRPGTAPKDLPFDAGRLAIEHPDQPNPPSHRTLHWDPQRRLPEVDWKPELLMATVGPGHPLVLALRDPGPADRIRFKLYGDGPALQAIVPPFEVTVPRSALRTRLDADGVTWLEFDGLAQLPDGWWVRGKQAVRAGLPRVRTAWLRIEATGWIGQKLDQPERVGFLQWSTRSLPVQLPLD